MASIGKRRKAAPKSKKAHRQIIVVGKRRPARRRVSGIGSTGIGKVRKARRKSRGFMGATGKSSVMAVVEMAVGVGVGAAATHMLLRPLEHKLAAKYPMATKFMGAAEILLGGVVALKSNKPFIKAVGVGILAGGVHTVMKQTHIGLESPAAMHGLDDMTTLHVPISGDLQDAIRGLIDTSGSRFVKTPTVGRMSGIVKHDRRATFTPTVGDPDQEGLSQEDRDFLYRPRGM